jgi:hypothetical protein
MSFVDDDGDAGGGGRRVDGDRQLRRRDVRRRDDVVDRLVRHRLHPDGLPDARRGGVEDAARVRALLADLLGVGVRRVGDVDDDLLRPGALERVGDVGGEGGVAALVLGDLRAVDVDRREVVDRAEVELQSLAAADVPARRHSDQLAVEHVVVMALDAGQE